MVRRKSQRGAGVKHACQALGNLVTSGRLRQVLSFEWDRVAKVPGPHWAPEHLNIQHWGRKRLLDSGSTEYLHQLYISIVPSETHITYIKCSSLVGDTQILAQEPWDGWCLLEDRD